MARISFYAFRKKYVGDRTREDWLVHGVNLLQGTVQPTVLTDDVQALEDQIWIQSLCAIYLVAKAVNLNILKQEQ